MSITITKHDTTSIRADAGAHNGATWLTIFFQDIDGGTVDFTTFIPFAKAERLADAINAAWAEPAAGRTYRETITSPLAMSGDDCLPSDTEPEAAA